MQYQLYRDGASEWRWRFFTNGRIIFASSEGYDNRADAVRAMEIARGSAGAERIEQHSDGKWYHMR